LMMSLWDALRMNMMISYQELVRTFPSGTRIILSKIFHVESWLIHVLLGTFIGVTAPLIFYKLVVRYRLNFIFEYPSHKKITIV
ncbi:hypothetical protein ELO54_23110, partial [Klebsiella pneumoniae]|nr:hypothetical protein [Klebsiella pneumoniae]MBL2736362.1 hypothetical protein [Klebsiella pneumoniae]MBL2742360.1 hypothetical protein [Klebsiella pneumoniae]MBL2764599.1 hypothetical protein [Klebsiella pneumoniae]MBL2775486.1 hypothetical protein [Klebsiella pneumoniae]